ncbi:hypothetical protein [Pseudomonas sp. TH15]|uniref:hypothetical protein n=1 Tax=Pseudomonas sp. TH15 TaxID=2796381 RepID=UPI00191484E0|nr:hypothetical protein [Pseudomonas sp. TH15]MBK5508765.1 hypothetical protein [Pseudomonas sp. TH15]
MSPLWKAGHDAYVVVADRIGKQPTIQDFKDIVQDIKENEKGWAPYIQQAIDVGQVTLRGVDGSITTNVARALEEGSYGWLLNVLMKYVTPSVISGRLSADDFPDFEALFSAMGIIYIDDYLFIKGVNSPDMDECYDLIHSSFTSAEIYRKSIDAAKEAVSAMGRRSAIARHKPTNQLRAAALAEWDARGANYSGMAAFARHHYKQYEVTERTLYGWVRGHRNAKS